MGKVRITRAHLEEDVGKLTHFDRTSGVDFNRAGVPLMEIVSEPDITSADMAYEYLNALKEILIQGGVSDCDMEKGMVRCDVNISVRPVGTKELGAKIEIKNMNSFSGVRRAAEYEIARQIEVVKNGGKLIQSTRRWDDVAGITEQMRTKEDAHDYRYFPDPDLMPFAPTDAWLAEVRSLVVELPLARKQRFIKEYCLAEYLAEVFKRNKKLSKLYEEFVKYAKDPETVAHLLITELSALGLENLSFSPKNFADLADMFFERKINGFAMKQVLSDMYFSGKDPNLIVQERGLAQLDDSVAIEKFCNEAISANPNSVSDYKSGKVAALNFLKGQVMKLSKGKANPALVGEILEQKLKS
jgi:aspartyl-tRNA(Asn)/glutamyl-tRNA(Gln) amidotransferase subunit B